ncbi:lysosome-associated membrane glycoprotein 1-like [Asterias rubens]|uniref:lysosome-associated membrane glycoprotein 1-like n=1 Tax=Asterias rubens TaxID=7604 RepID=UPI0014554E8E|nr:lysosome-associated membrane glycoprotein 1-like [Asterias rubens]
MAANRRRKTMVVMRGLVLLMLCVGFCVCEEEVTDVEDPPQQEQDEGKIEGTAVPDDQRSEAVEPQQPDDKQTSDADEQQQPDDDQTSDADEHQQPEDDQTSDADEQQQPEDDQTSDADEQQQPEDDTSDAEPASEADGQWGNFAVTDAPEEETPVDEESQADVKDQSEAPEDVIPSTETPEVETESATSVSSQKPKPDSSEQPDERGDFMVPSDGSSPICLRACFTASFVIDYVGLDEDKKVVNRSTEIPVPKKANVGGQCGLRDDQSFLTLQWDEGRYTLKITFQKKNATKKGNPNFWEARMIKFTFDTGDTQYFDSAINAGSRVVHSDPSMRFFVTPIGNSRVCDSEDDIIMTSAGNTTETVTMEISELQMQPFGMVNGTFGEESDCGKDLIANPSTNVASIAVGATLACLILVVIIVYAVGRKMGAINDRSGYKSVE